MYVCLFQCLLPLNADTVLLKYKWLLCSFTHANHFELVFRSKHLLIFFQDEAAFEQVFSDALFKSYIFKMRAKVETYNVSLIDSRLGRASLGLVFFSFSHMLSFILKRNAAPRPFILGIHLICISLELRPSAGGPYTPHAKRVLAKCNCAKLISGESKRGYFLSQSPARVNLALFVWRSAAS